MPRTIEERVKEVFDVLLDSDVPLADAVNAASALIAKLLADFQAEGYRLTSLGKKP